MSPTITPEISELRKKIKKLSKNDNFLKNLHEETKISFSHISLFKDWKRWISTEKFFLLKKAVEALEEIYGSIE